MYDDFPSKDRSKAARRRKDHIRKLEKAKFVAKKVFKYGPVHYTKEELDEMIDTWARHHAENLQTCSCHMCGNARRMWNECTLAEKKNLIAYQEQLNTLDSDE